MNLIEKVQYKAGLVVSGKAGLVVGREQIKIDYITNWVGNPYLTGVGIEDYVCFTK